MTPPAPIPWLLDNGGPAIRYRTATELQDDPSGRDVAQLAADLLASSMAQTWLDRVGQPGNLSAFHGSHPEAFENAAYKLADLGLHAGMAPLDERVAPCLHWLAEHAASMARVPHGFDAFEAVLVAAPLAWMGYGEGAEASETLRLCLARRLDTLYTLAQTGNHAIYIDQDTFGDFPNNPFRKKPLVDPQFNGRLPSIHDIYALAHYPPDMLDAVARRKIEAVIAYILHPDYQALREGYGVIRTGPRRYFSMGWSVHLPGYDGLDFGDGPAARFVQRLELMAHFPVARAHRWYRESLAHLETFRTAEDVYRFPARYLPEASRGYWVKGAAMRLEDKRRRRIALTLDSTFRMATLQRFQTSS